jgi:hypothetical protein
MCSDTSMGSRRMLAGYAAAQLERLDGTVYGVSEWLASLG